VALEVPLAGLGSRFVAALVDGVIKGAVILAALAGVVALGATSGPGPVPEPTGDLALIGLAVFFVFGFLVNFGYDVLFETLASGRTPGKRWTGLRVVRLDGGPVNFTTSAVRNLVRLVDGLFGYAVGVVAILVSARNQRLGDLAAGTVVVRERRAPDLRRDRRPAGAGMPVPPAVPESSGELVSWDITSVTADDLMTVRRFLERRPELTSEARARLAHDFALRLRPKVAGAPEDLHPEEFLERLAAAKAART
jgi:uncharacterized RDD family membrane protein YckC